MLVALLLGFPVYGELRTRGRAQTVDTVRLEYYPGRFVVRSSSGAWPVPLHPSAPPVAKSTEFRRDDVYAVWDDRGLTVRQGGRTRSFRLEEFPVSDRFFSAEEIRTTVDQINAGERKRGADALSGALRLGPDAYFLLRWDGRDGRAWSEALVRVPLVGKDVSPEILGRLPGTSLAFRPVDHRLILSGGRLACIVRQGGRWGVVRYDTKTRQFDFRVFGQVLRSFMADGPDVGKFVETSTYGTTVAGRIDLRSDFRRILLETRGQARFLDGMRPPIIVNSDHDFVRAINGDTGMELRLGENYQVARAGEFILAWAPGDRPLAAAVYSADPWTKRASWRAPK